MRFCPLGSVAKGVGVGAKATGMFESIRTEASIIGRAVSAVVLFMFFHSLFWQGISFIAPLSLALAEGIDSKPEKWADIFVVMAKARVCWRSAFKTFVKSDADYQLES